MPKMNEYDVHALNNVILQAVKHGADMGGSYCSNEEALVESMVAFARRMGWDGLCIYEEPTWGAPQYGVILRQNTKLEKNDAENKSKANTAHAG